MSYKRINVSEARELIDEASALIVDVRDPDSYRAGHMPGATLVNEANVREFIEEADFDRPLVVCCYHGNMSQDAAEYFNAHGFKQAYSVDGGYEAWQSFQSEPPPTGPSVQLADLPRSARVWIYGAAEPVTPEQRDALGLHMKRFLTAWNSHEQTVMPGWQLVHDQFVVIGADETAMNLSGCSIDSMFHALEDFNRSSGLNFASSGNQVFYRDDTGTVQCVDRIAFAGLAKKGSINEETVVFNNVIGTVGEFLGGRWEVPMRDSWHMDVFGKSMKPSS